MKLEGVAEDVAVLTTGQAAVACNFKHERGAAKGKPNRNLLRAKVRNGTFPQPINPDDTLAHWRWYRGVVEAWITGDWKPTAPDPDEAA